MKILFDQIKYNRWANTSLIETSAELDSISFRQNIESSFPSVQKTWIHIIWAEELWLQRWQGRAFFGELSILDYPNIESIRRKIDDLSQSQIQFLKSLKAGDEDKKISYENNRGENWEYSLGQMVQHMTLHSTYHRGQIVTMLRQLKITPPGLDYLIYVDIENKAKKV